MKCIMTRRSVRKYSARKMTEAQLRKVLEAAMNAPSAGNQQAWQFVVVRDRATLERITGVHPYAQMLKDAQAAIVICGDLPAERHKDYWVQDCAAATQNALLAAHAQGLGAVWLGVHPRADRVAGVRRVLGLPKGIVPLSVVSLGYPGEKPKAVKRYSRSKVHFERW
ncbi:MAG: nitroreductase family protein [Candidatus Edwardsbacteria bacterium]|nr:nitroreductase family protein [Candidatus Edwardsbacteria bacterium]